MDRGALQGVLVVQTTESRSFRADEISMLVAATAQLGPLVSGLRALEHFVARLTSGCGPWPATCGGAGTAKRVSLFRDLDPVRWREFDHNPIVLLPKMSLDQLEQRAGSWCCTAASTRPIAACSEYLESAADLGRTHAGVLRARPVAYFSAEFGLHESVPIYSGGLGVLSGDHIKSAADLGVPLVAVGLYLRPGLLPPAARHATAGSRRIPRLERRRLADRAGHRTAMVSRSRSRSTRAAGDHSARVWKLHVGRIMLYLLDSDVDGNAAGRSRADRPAVRRRHAHPHSPGAGAGRRRRPRAAGAGHHAGRLSSQRRAQRVRLLELIRQRMDAEGIDFDEAMRRVSRARVFTTHTPVPAGHDRFRRT